MTNDLIVPREGQTWQITFAQIGAEHINRTADQHSNDV